MKHTSLTWTAAMTIACLLGCNRATPTLTPALTDAATIANNAEPRPAAPQVDDETQGSQPQTDAVRETTRPADDIALQPMVTNVGHLTSGPLAEPYVILSDAHKATCRLLVGGSIVDAKVTDISGTDHRLLKLLDQQLTVMIFWSEQSTASLEQFRRIPIDILADFAPAVTVIAVNEGSELAQVKNLTGDAAERIVSLVDREGALFNHFATDLLPRTYIVDQQGKILWFDIEYSQSTQRSLRDALAYFLKNS